MVPRFDEIVSYTLDILPVVEPILIITFGLFLAGLVLSFVRRWFGNSPMPFLPYEPSEGEINYTVTHPYGGSDVCEYCGSFPGYGSTCRGCGAPNVLGTIDCEQAYFFNETNVQRVVPMNN